MLGRNLKSRSLFNHATGISRALDREQENKRAPKKNLLVPFNTSFAGIARLNSNDCCPSQSHLLLFLTQKSDVAQQTSPRRCSVSQTCPRPHVFPFPQQRARQPLPNESSPVAVSRFTRPTQTAEKRVSRVLHPACLLEHIGARAAANRLGAERDRAFCLALGKLHPRCVPSHRDYRFANFANHGYNMSAWKVCDAQQSHHRLACRLIIEMHDSEHDEQL
ncbi:hypothetical protein FB567DRAFT_263948 [Paraphoma chrysanthemicola]|uniref:Uncharacterized protein n=1 Tax=Paraphoma chrysanthemicola TaxID=798071 RepID=A0A8K0W1L3_9PLEO|nr:hypothetical protein FB567DRAFT_263948 [Paraphoma chrysanthemicola]